MATKKKTVDSGIIMKARLVDSGIAAPKPGTIYSISLMHYKVLKVMEGNYEYESVLVGHHLPDLNSNDFKTGALHCLWLVHAFPEGANLLNKFQEDNLTAQKMFCISFRKIKFL